MVPKLEEWSLVILGQWNVRIFSPDWVARNLFTTSNVQMEVALAPSASHLRFRQPLITLAPLDDRIVIACNAPTEAALSEAEHTARRLIDLLNHTPIAACGINMGFVEADPPALLLSLFTFPDDIALGNATPGAVIRREVTRAIQVQHGVLNLKHRFNGTDVQIDFNFHHETPSAAAAEKVLKNRARWSHGHALHVLTSAYGLQLESGSHESA